MCCIIGVPGKDVAWVMLAGRYLLALHEPPGRLLDDLCNPRDKGRNGRSQRLGHAVWLQPGVLLKMLLHLLGLILTAPPRRINKLLGNRPDAA